MNREVIDKEVQQVSKQGFLEKQSRILKTWRQRWVVLTPNLLLTFKERKVYKNSTESIVLKDIVSIKSVDEGVDKGNAFKVETDENTFLFTAESNTEKEAWIGGIGKAMVKATSKGKDW